MSLSSNFATELARYSAHGSGAGLDAAVSAAAVFAASLDSNLAAGRRAICTPIFEDLIYHLMERYASEFK